MQGWQKPPFEPAESPTSEAEGSSRVKAVFWRESSITVPSMRLLEEIGGDDVGFRDGGEAVAMQKWRFAAQNAGLLHLSSRLVRLRVTAVQTRVVSLHFYPLGLGRGSAPEATGGGSARRRGEWSSGGGVGPCPCGRCAPPPVAVIGRPGRYAGLPQHIC